MVLRVLKNLAREQLYVNDVAREDVVLRQRFHTDNIWLQTCKIWISPVQTPRH